MKQLATNVIEAMRSQPLGIALVVISLMWMLWGGFVMREIGNAVERRDAIIQQLIEQCGRVK